MDKELIREVLASGSAMLTQMAEAAKTTGEHLYSVLVRQQMVDGIAGLLAWTTYCITMFLIYRGAPARLKNAKDDDTTVLIVFLYALVTVGLFFVWSGIEYNLKHILNPEYYAIEFIINSVKGAK